MGLDVPGRIDAELASLRGRKKDAKKEKKDTVVSKVAKKAKNDAAVLIPRPEIPIDYPSPTPPTPF